MPDSGKRGPKRDYEREHQANMAFILRLAVLGYVLYLVGQMVWGYVTGAEGATLWLTVGTVLVLGGAAVALGVVLWRDWRRKLKEAELTDEEAARIAEEIAAADRENGLLPDDGEAADEKRPGGEQEEHPAQPEQK